MDANIIAAVGANGHGKTLYVAENVVIPSWRKGVPVVGNLALYPERIGLPELTRDGRPFFEPLTGWRQLTELRDCTLILDEITSVFPSRQALSLPPQLQRVLNQLRKVNVTVVWTAPAWARADKILREVTQYVTVCRGFMPDRWQRVPERARGLHLNPKRDGEVESLWAPRRLFSFSTYNAQDLENEVEGKSTGNVAKPIKRSWYWRPRHLGQLAYSTLEAVSLLDHLDDIGVCLSCGGHRARKKCTCALHDEASGEAVPKAGVARGGDHHHHHEHEPV